MKKVNWIIDKYVFEDYEDRLITSIKNSNHNVHIFDDSNGKTLENFLNKFTEDDIIFFHGSLQHGRRFERMRYYPGIYLTLENYECYKYYGYYGDYLLNSNYLMMGLNDVIRNKEKIFDTFKTSSIFIRPSNGYKSFPGQTLPLDNFYFEFNVLKNSYGGIDLDKLVVVSPAIKINEEYRFIIIDGVPISGSLYIDDNNR